MRRRLIEAIVAGSLLVSGCGGLPEASCNGACLPWGLSVGGGMDGGMGWAMGGGMGGGLARGPLAPAKVQGWYRTHKNYVLAVVWGIPGGLLIIAIVGLAVASAGASRSTGAFVFWMSGAVVWLLTVLGLMAAVRFGQSPLTVYPPLVALAPPAFLVLSAIVLRFVDFNYPVRNWLLLCLAGPLAVLSLATGVATLKSTLADVSSRLRGLLGGLGN